MTKFHSRAHGCELHSMLQFPCFLSSNWRSDLATSALLRTLINTMSSLTSSRQLKPLNLAVRPCPKFTSHDTTQTTDTYLHPVQQQICWMNHFRPVALLNCRIIFYKMKAENETVGVNVTYKKRRKKDADGNELFW